MRRLIVAIVFLIGICANTASPTVAAESSRASADEEVQALQAGTRNQTAVQRTATGREKRLQSCNRKLGVCQQKCGRFVKARRGSYTQQALSRMSSRCSRRCRAKASQCKSRARA